MKPDIKLLPLILIPLLAACTLSFSHPLSKQAIATFKPGVTTIQEVKTQLGPPTKIKRTGSTVLVYTTHEIIRANAASFIPLVGPLVGEAEKKYQYVTFTFGLDGKLKTISRSNSKMQHSKAGG
jgi:hypothetical protein